jgi:hypothetical protein
MIVRIICSGKEIIIEGKLLLQLKVVRDTFGCNIFESYWLLDIIR